MTSADYPFGREDALHTSNRLDWDRGSTRSPPTKARPMASQRTILVVDDERSIRDLLVSVLVEEGYAVRCAEDGLAALAEVERQPPDLVVSDVAMPRLDGFALAGHLMAKGIAIVLV